MKRDGKQANILRLFIEGYSLNTFEAEQWGDHSLNSTVSTLYNRYRLDFDREWEQVPNRFGGMTRVKRYRLTDTSRPDAWTLLMRWRGSGDAIPD